MSLRTFEIQDVDEQTKIARERTKVLLEARRACPMIHDVFDDAVLKMPSHVMLGNSRRMLDQFRNNPGGHLLCDATDISEERKNIEAADPMLQSMSRSFLTHSNQRVGYAKILKPGTDDQTLLRNAGLDATWRPNRFSPRAIPMGMLHPNRLKEADVVKPNAEMRSFRDLPLHQMDLLGRPKELCLFSGVLTPDNIADEHLGYFRTETALLATPDALDDPTFPCLWATGDAPVSRQTTMEFCTTANFPALVYGRFDSAFGRTDYIKVETIAIIFSADFRYVAAILRDLGTLHYQAYMPAMPEIFRRLFKCIG